MNKIECNPAEISAPEPEFSPAEMWSVMGAQWDDFKAFYKGDITEHVTKRGGKEHRHMHLRRGGKVLGLAHLDSVQKFSHFWMDGNRKYVACPTIDNRLGAWVLLNGLRKMGIVMDILLCDEEEKGGSTARDFQLPAGVEYNWMVSFDRMNDDVVMYQYDFSWDKAILRSFGFKPGHGSCSDISSADHLGILGINIGCGMKDYHSVDAYADLGELSEQMKRFYRFHSVYGDTRLEYVKSKWEASKRVTTYSYPTEEYVPRSESWSDHNWDMWLAEEAKDKKAIAKIHNVPQSDIDKAELIYATFMLLGINAPWFNGTHPISWCSRHSKPKPANIIDANHKNLVQCARCTRYFNWDDCEFLYQRSEEYCKYCYLLEAEALGLLAWDWYELATSTVRKEFS